MLVIAQTIKNGTTTDRTSEIGRYLVRRIDLARYLIEQVAGDSIVLD